MAIKVLIPTPLRSLTGGVSEVRLEAADIKSLIAELEKAYPGFRTRLYLKKEGEEEKLNRFVNLYADEEDIRFLQGENTPLAGIKEVSIIAAIAGGRN